MRQPDRADHIVGVLTLATDLLSCVQTRIAVLFEEPKKVFPVHKVQLAGLYRLHRRLVRLACENCVQAEDFPRLRDPQDEGFPLPRSGGKLGLTLAKHEDSARALAFNKNDCAFRKNRSMFYSMESFQRLVGEGAEEIV